jgi:aryl-phospho-beta-D-glucosidase BglC (GH1 family)
MPPHALFHVSRAIGAIIVALGLLLPIGAPPRAAPVNGFVHAQGKRLVDAAGREFPVRGVNLGHWLVPEAYMFGFDGDTTRAQMHDLFARLLGAAGADAFWQRFRDTFISEDDIRFIAAAGFNTVRVPMDWTMFVRHDGANGAPIFEGPGYALIDRLLGWAHAAGLRVLLDLHAAPGGQTGASFDGGSGYPLLFYVPADRALTVRLWQELARRYRDEPAVLGYDLLNEPVAPYHNTKYLEPRLEPLLREITEAIRAVDPNHLVFLTGGRWSTTVDALGPPFDRNVAYTYHMFWARPQRSSIEKLLNFRDRYDVPLVLTETGEATEDWVVAFRRLNETNGVGWVLWTYKNMPSPATIVAVKKPADWQAIIDYVNRARNGTDVPLPPRPVAERAFADYLSAIAFRSGTIKQSYLQALGLKVPP